MKKYILMGQIAGIGGWQLYMDARATYLSTRNIEVYLISISDLKKNKIELRTFDKYKSLCIPEIHLPPLVYNAKAQEHILLRVMNFIEFNQNDEVFIESTDMWLSMWGELLAKEMRAINFSYLLHSHIENISSSVQKYFDFKYGQQLLAGMSELTLPELFNGYVKLPNDDVRRIYAVPKDSLSDENNLEDITNRIIDYKNSGGKVIAYFGNLTKPHFVELCEVISDYVYLHSDQNFMFLTIGSSSYGKAEKMQKKLAQKLKNCVCLNIAEQYPIPKAIFKVMDVCIASWGCSDDASRAKAITIRLLNDKNITPQGIMGITLTGPNYYLSPPIDKTIPEMLDDILFKKIYSPNDIQQLGETKDYIKYNKLEDEIIRPFEKRDVPIQYYDISEIQYINKRVAIEKVLVRFFGIKLTLKVIDILKLMLLKNI